MVIGFILIRYYYLVKTLRITPLLYLKYTEDYEKGIDY
jgi:hypothetical protein